MIKLRQILLEHEKVDTDKLFYDEWYLDRIATGMGYNDDFTSIFWKLPHVPTLYHCTEPDRWETIKTEGLKAMNKTRGINNRSVGKAVFTTMESEEVSYLKGYYGSLVIEINAQQMKNDNFMPDVEREMDWERAQKIAFVLNKMGREDVEAARFLDSSDGYTEGTVIVYSDIPVKYLSLSKENNRIQEDKEDELRLNKTKEAADFLIKQTWKIMPKEDRYSEYQLFLWMDNERELTEKKEEIALQLFPEEKYPTEKLDSIITDRLEELEREKHSKIKKKINTLDPLFLLKQIVIRKSYERAKAELIKNSLGGWGYTARTKIDDEKAEEAFNRMYRNAMGETIYDKSNLKKQYQLSSLRRKNTKDFNIDSSYENSINMLIDHYVGTNVEKFPEKVKVYRGVNTPTAPIRPGDYVTFDKDYARAYMRGKYGSVISDIINSSDLYVDKFDIHQTEMLYWPEGHQIKNYDGHIPTFREFWKEVNSW